MTTARVPHALALPVHLAVPPGTPADLAGLLAPSPAIDAACASLGLATVDPVTAYRPDAPSPASDPWCLCNGCGHASPAKVRLGPPPRCGHAQVRKRLRPDRAQRRTSPSPSTSRAAASRSTTSGR